MSVEPGSEHQSDWLEFRVALERRLTALEVFSKQTTREVAAARDDVAGLRSDLFKMLTPIKTMTERHDADLKWLKGYFWQGLGGAVAGGGVLGAVASWALKHWPR